MNFYHDLITGKSWELLKKLSQNYDFILIGGWAVYLYTQALKSKDIDLVLDYEGLEKFKKYACSLEGFSVVEKEVLAILKGKALLERKNTPKGRKDLIDLVSLFGLPDFDFRRYKKIIKEYKLEPIFTLVQAIIQKTPKIEELGLNVHQMARLKRTINR